MEGKKVSKAVVILGAGASSDFGVPTLQGIFKDKWARQYLREDIFLANKLQEIFWEPRGHALESSDQSVTIEEMLTMLRDWESEANCKQTLAPDFIEEFRKRLYVLIMRAVYEGKSTKSKHLNPLIDICNRKFEHITWASFNWDCVFDASFWYWQTYAGPNSRSNPSLSIPMENAYGGWSKHKLLKLHGSINWWQINGHLTYVPFAMNNELRRRWAEYSQNQNPNSMPVILEPSAYKYQDDFYKLLEPQWNEFFHHLYQANCVIIVGYSLPEGDTQARSKIMTAFNTNRNCKWLLIDPSESTCARYIRLLGQKNLTVSRLGLVGFNNEIHANLQQAFSDIDFSEPSQQPPATQNEN